jgi:hypothetical protein
MRAEIVVNVIRAANESAVAPTGFFHTFDFMISSNVENCSTRWSWLKAWAMKIAKQRGIKKRSWCWRVGWLSSYTASGLGAPNIGGLGKL